MTKSENTEGRWKLRLFLATILVLSIVTIWGSIVHLGESIYSMPTIPNLDHTLGNWAKFGDSFGLLNALFSGLAFAAVVVALTFQSHEISRQYEDRKKTTEASEKQAEISAYSSLLDSKENGIALTLHHYEKFSKLYMSGRQGVTHKDVKDCKTELERILDSRDKIRGKIYTSLGESDPDEIDPTDSGNTELTVPFDSIPDKHPFNVAIKVIVDHFKKYGGGENVTGLSVGKSKIDVVTENATAGLCEESKSFLAREVEDIKCKCEEKGNVTMMIIKKSQAIEFCNNLDGHKIENEKPGENRI